MNDNPLSTSFRGIPIVVSGPSGVGKGTLVTGLIQQCPNLVHSVSMTTRSPRPGEREGETYFFVSPERFRQAVEQHELVEWATVYEYSYGTPQSYLDDQFEKGNDVILDIDVQGAAAIRSLYPRSLLIFIVSPSLEHLRKRLLGRAKGQSDNLEKRLQLAQDEMRFMGMFDYVVINDQLEVALDRMKQIVLADRSRLERMQPVLHGMNIEALSSSSQQDPGND